MFSRSAVAFLLLLLGTQYSVLSTPVQAHPVPRRFHDRVITVRLTPEAVLVDYHLELDEWTVVFVDLPAVNDQVDLTKLTQPKEFYEAFTRAYAPILADNLLARLDGKPLSFTCARRGYQAKDSLWCDFVFQAPWQPPRDRPLAFVFQETNYELETGQVKLSLVADPALKLLEKTEPDEALKNRPATDLRPGDEGRLRKTAATFLIPTAPLAAEPRTTVRPPSSDSAAEKAPAPTTPGEATTTRDSATANEVPARPGTLLGLLLDSGQGLWVLLFFAAGFGAAHAFTPGHGKTLVAAYLVGERGTVWHALLLGLMTTLSHTGSVLLLALLLLFLPANLLDPALAVLGVVGGLAIAGFGFWLLLRRLSGRVDHVHIGGHGHHHHGPNGHHHHHHGAADHYHDEHGHALPLPAASDPVGWWGLVVLGLSGGIVPCVDAIIMLFFAVTVHRLWLALPLLLAFSAGLASVLVLLGVLVVSAKRVAQQRLGEDSRFQRVFRALPIVSAAVIMLMGLWLSRESLAQPPTPPPVQVPSRP
jgi:ABC-type nickel/cobalt efflux system permease component RcnA